MVAIGAILTPAQETNITSRFDQDDDLWLILFSIFMRSKSENIEAIKEHFIAGDAEWKSEASKAREMGFEDIKQMIEKTLQWNVRTKMLLTDPGNITLIRLCLRNTNSLRAKKIPSTDPNGNARRQIYTVLSTLAGDVSLNLDPYLDMTRCLDRNQTPGGKDLTDVSRNYYQSRQNDYFNLISTYLALMILLKTAATNQDIVQCQDLIRRNMIKPLELKVDSLDKNDKKDAWNRLDNYSKIVHSMDIQLS